MKSEHRDLSAHVLCVLVGLVTGILIGAALVWCLAGPVEPRAEPGSAVPEKRAAQADFE